MDVVTGMDMDLVVVVVVKETGDRGDMVLINLRCLTCLSVGFFRFTFCFAFVRSAWCRHGCNVCM